MIQREALSGVLVVEFALHAVTDLLSVPAAQETETCETTAGCGSARCRPGRFVTNLNLRRLVSRLLDEDLSNTINVGTAK